MSFKNTIVVMTSNTGGHLRGEGLGFCAGGRDAAVRETIRQTFPPEFLGRIDQTVCFEKLGRSAMEAILGKYLSQLQERTAAVGTQLQYGPELSGWLLDKAGGSDGARQLRRLVQSEVEGPLAAFLLRSGRKPGRITVRLDRGSLSFCA